MLHKFSKNKDDYRLIEHPKGIFYACSICKNCGKEWCVTSGFFDPKLFGECVTLSESNNILDASG